MASQTAQAGLAAATALWGNPASLAQLGAVGGLAGDKSSASQSSPYFSGFDTSGWGVSVATGGSKASSETKGSSGGMGQSTPQNYAGQTPYSVLDGSFVDSCGGLSMGGIAGTGMTQSQVAVGLAVLLLVVALKKKKG